MTLESLDRQLHDLLHQLHRECIIADEWLHPEAVAPGLSRALARGFAKYQIPSEWEHDRSYWLTRKGRFAIGRPTLLDRTLAFIEVQIDRVFD